MTIRKIMKYLKDRKRSYYQKQKHDNKNNNKVAKRQKEFVLSPTNA